MSDTDQMTDSAELRELRDSLSNLAMPERPRLEAITARGRARRRQRLSRSAAMSVAGVATVTALALGLTGALGPARVHDTARTLAPGTIRTAAFKLVKNANGTATLTINPKVLLDPATLQSDLAKYGIPAKVTSGSYCSSDPAPGGFSRVVSMQPPGDPTPTADSGEQSANSGVKPGVTFDPVAMPAGTELSFGYFQTHSGQTEDLLFALIDTGSYTCTSTPPGPNETGPHAGVQVVHSGPPGS